ncbi:MAG TPA: M14 family zinc carboxypeptidase [Phycisphaerae bacterium]|nr:M14 family zinc carboxypeptidase [Phycisphaerae bacterium]HNU46251.1 M14 family zinc carboxypeptidase [Phycisphaerae bacterium]
MQIHKMAGMALAAVVLGGGLTAPARADSWTTYAEIGPTLLSYETSYPTLAKRYNIGSSYQGRSLWAIRLSDNVLVEEDEPEFKYISTMHGDEIVGTKMCMMLIDWLLTNYGTDPDATNIIDNVELWIVPLMNPDGYDRSPRIRENAQGYDLNRNFPDYGDPNTPTGRPTEVQVIMNWSFGRSFTCSANLHTGALVINYPFDNEDSGSRYTPDDDLMIYISEQYSYYNQPMWNGSFYHGITNGATWYFVWGGMQDWNYHFMGNNEVTIELSTTKQPAASTIPTYWSNNRQSMLAYIQTCLIGVRGLVTDATSGRAVAATVRVVGRNHDIFTDPDVGDYHRMLMPGTYDLTFSATGYDPLRVNNVVVGSGNAARLDVQLYGAPTVAYPNGGEELESGLPATVTWTGNPAAQFQVQYTDNYGDMAAVSDGFESGTLGPAYTSGGGAAWLVTTSSYHTGTRSARAGAITHNQTSWLQRNANGGNLRFWYRVSSEASYDFFNFYIDGNRQLHLSGTVAWTQYSTTLSAGSHVLRWEYTKDESQSSGSDTVWIDDLELTVDNTTWTDILPLSETGQTQTTWTPGTPGDDYKVRVRSYVSGTYGDWDESNATFTIVPAASADGDYDQDGDVDLADYAAFQNCFGQPAGGACGQAFNFAVDGTIDLEDFVDFVPELTGPLM